MPKTPSASVAKKFVFDDCDGCETDDVSYTEIAYNNISISWNTSKLKDINHADNKLLKRRNEKTGALFEVALSYSPEPE
jgi:hypothetical protein